MAAPDVSIAAALLIVLVVGGGAATVYRYTREITQARDEVDALNASLEQRVAARTADLARANEEIQQFAHIVSHDLRAPLVNIVGFTGELEHGLNSVQAALKAGDARRGRRQRPRCRRRYLHPLLDPEDGYTSSTPSSSSRAKAHAGCRRSGSISPR